MLGEMKKCPKCGRIMIDERIKTGRNWQVIWHCLCEYREVETSVNKRDNRSIDGTFDTVI